MADPTFVHHANSMVELLQKGSECFMSTAWKAMKSDERTPYKSERLEGMAVIGRSDDDGATPVINPMVTTADATSTKFEGLDFVHRNETRMVSGKTRPRAIWYNNVSYCYTHRRLDKGPERTMLQHREGIGCWILARQYWQTQLVWASCRLEYPAWVSRFCSAIWVRRYAEAPPLWAAGKEEKQEESLGNYSIQLCSWDNSVGALGQLLRRLGTWMTYTKTI